MSNPNSLLDLPLPSVVDILGKDIASKLAEALGKDLDIPTVTEEPDKAVYDCRPTDEERQEARYFLQGEGEKYRSIMGVKSKIPTEHVRQLVQLVQHVQSDATCVNDKVSFSRKAAAFIDVVRCRRTFSSSCMDIIYSARVADRKALDEFGQIDEPRQLEAYFRNASDEFVAKVYGAMGKWALCEIYKYKDDGDLAKYLELMRHSRSRWAPPKIRALVSDIHREILMTLQLPSCSCCQEVKESDVVHMLIQSAGQSDPKLLQAMREMSMSMTECIASLNSLHYEVAVSVHDWVEEWGRDRSAHARRQGART